MNPRIKILEDQLAAAPDGTTEKVDALNSLAWEIWSANRELAVNLTAESGRLAEKLNYKKGLVYHRLNRAISTWQEDIEQAFSAFLDGLAWFEEEGEKKGIADTCAALGVIYWGFGDFDRGFELGNRALKLYHELGEIDGEGWAQNSIGAFHYDLKDYKQSLAHFRKGLALFKKAGNLIGQGRALNGIGNANHYMGDYDKSLEYHQKSIKLAQKTGHGITESRALNDIGLLYQTLGKYEEALEYHQQSLAIRREMNYPPGITTTLMDLGEIYLRQGSLDTSLEVVNEALALSEKIKGKPKIVRALQLLSQIYEKKKDYKKALQYHQQQHEIEEEVFHEDAEKKLKNMKSAYQLENSRKEAEIYRLKNVELKEKNDQLTETIRKLNATQAQLVQSGKMVALGNLVAGIAHEINTPIGAIKSGNDLTGRIADKLMTALESDTPFESLLKELQKSLNVLETNSRNNLNAIERIINIINSLKNFSRLDEAKFQKADIHEGIDSALTLIGHEIKENISVTKEYGDVPQLYLFANELNQVFMNILINAVQATPENGSIKIKTFSENNHTHVKISDSGKGIPAEKLDQLFEPGFTTEQSRVKMRTGLYTSFNIISKHKGDIKAESSPGKGTTFTISIPNNLNEVLAAEMN